MVVESIAIFAIILSMIVIFLRTKKEYASLTLPLLFIPAANIIAMGLSKKLAAVLPFDRYFVSLLFIILALILSGIVIGVQCSKFKTKKVKVYYSLSILLFNLVLSAIIIYNNFSVYIVNSN